MEHAARDRLAALLGGHAMHAVSSVQLEAGVADLQLAVDGLGPIKLPVTQARARQLAQLGQPAQFGLGEQTLTDSRVRDTWEIPKDLVHAEWSDAFGTILGAIRDRLGLPDGSELAADFHSMLVYERGQFFASHQDSEKDDSMIGTLVVTLPSAYTGGELVIEHGGQSTRYQGKPDVLSLVAFYGDCRHEILPLNSGRRITLTYNLLLHGDATASATGDDATVAELARLVEEHFTTPITNRYSQAEAAPPSRLVYLLDHEYTARGLSWSRLKGADAARMPLVRAAAEQAGCAAVLALADVKETWSAFKAGDRYRDWDEEDDEDEDDGRYEIQELIDSSITLTHWTAGPARTLLSVRDTEACATTRSADLRPIASEYEGYMGNYGNTLDRWYKRAAVVVWPSELEFANRAEASPAWALDELVARARDDLAGARIAAATVAELWDMTVRVTEQAGLLGKALSAAAALGDPIIAAMLLRPFAVERLSVADVPPLAYLAGQHGQQWTAELLRSWFGEGSRPYYAVAQGRPQWIASLPGLCRALQASPTAHLLLDLSWDWLRNMIGGGAEQQSPTYRDEALREMGPPLAAVLAAAAVAEAGELRDQIVGFCREQGDEMIPCEMAALRAAAGAPGFGDLTADCTERLRRRLARPVRAADDWSIELPGGCACELCVLLGKFLADPARRTLEWKLAKAGRQHIHSRIDTAELPVQHQTRRQGSPFTLVLTKTQALFDREHEARSRDEADLAML